MKKRDSNSNQILIKFIFQTLFLTNVAVYIYLYINKVLKIFFNKNKKRFENYTINQINNSFVIGWNEKSLWTEYLLIYLNHVVQSSN